METIKKAIISYHIHDTLTGKTCWTNGNGLSVWTLFDQHGRSEQALSKRLELVAGCFCFGLRSLANCSCFGFNWGYDQLPIWNILLFSFKHLVPHGTPPRVFPTVAEAYYLRLKGASKGELLGRDGKEQHESCDNLHCDLSKVSRSRPMFQWVLLLNATSEQKQRSQPNQGKAPPSFLHPLSKTKWLYECGPPLSKG